MNRNELIEKKNRIENECRKLSNSLKTARREFAATGKGLPRIELSNMEAKEAFLKNELQKIAASLSLCNDSKNNLVQATQREFVNVARSVLEDDVFYSILKKAGDIAAERIRGVTHSEGNK